MPQGCQTLLSAEVARGGRTRSSERERPSRGNARGLIRSNYQEEVVGWALTSIR